MLVVSAFRSQSVELSIKIPREIKECQGSDMKLWEILLNLFVGINQVEVGEFLAVSLILGYFESTCYVQRFLFCVVSGKAIAHKF